MDGKVDITICMPPTITGTKFRNNSLSGQTPESTSKNAVTVEDACLAIINAADRKKKKAIFPGWLWNGLVVFQLYPAVYDKAILAEAKL